MEQETIRLICKRGKELFVARSLLIQSSRYFAALFSKESNWLESSIGTIELDSWRRDDLATILQSLTTKETEAIFKNVNYYFAAINYFSIYPLMEQCIELKIKNITDESVIADLEFAECFSVVALRDQCIEYLLRRLPDLLRGSRRSRRKMSAELLEKLLRHENLGVRNEDEVLLLIDAWCSWGERKSERSKFLQYVRFAHLTKNAFEKCRQDAQCLQVSRFRRLLETPRWSDLNEEFLSGRKTSRVHYHILGFLSTNDEAEEEKLREYDEFADEPVLHCSEAGTLSTGSVSIEGASPTTKTPYKPSIVFGTAYYDYHIPAYSFYLSTGERVQLFSGFAYHPDSRDLNMSHPVTLREYLYIVAAPVYFKDYLFVVHMPFKNEPTLQHGRNILEPEVCDYLQVYRFYGEKACFRTFRINIESHPRELRICQCLGSGINCFFVDDQWMILCLPNQDVLLVLHPVRRTIELAEQCLLMKNSHRLRTKSCSEMVVIGHVAYVLINFSFFDSIEPQSGEPPFNHGETLAGSITAYDLTEGEWLPGHFVDLTPYFAEKMTFGSIEEEDFSLFLKVVQDELFLIIVSSRVEPRQSGFPLASVDYVYRLKRSDDRLWLSPVTDSAAAAARVNKWLERDKLTLFTWSGNPEYVDVHPCKYASMLQLKASQEEDPNERNKLRRFIW